MCAFAGILEHSFMFMETKIPNTLLGVEIPDSALGSKTVLAQLGVLIAIGITVWLWIPILSGKTAENSLYILDVGQGDSQLVQLASPEGRSSVEVLIDGGKDRAVLHELNEVLGNRDDKYIDIVILTHPDLDHFGGLIEVVRRYDVGVFISNGRKGTSEAFADLENVLHERNIQSISLMEGDSIRYGNHVFTIISPDKALIQSKEINEASIVTTLSSGGVEVLFTGDIGFPAERALLRKKHNLSADILKVGHHGSKNSSSENFIAAVQPKIATIGVGKNSYGHPTPRVLETLELAGSRVYRTDTDGTIEIPLKRDAVIKEKIQKQGLFASIASIMTGSYRQENFTRISLAEPSKEALTSHLIPYKTCTFRMGGTPSHSPLIFSEIAWMGRVDAATHEWIELRSISGKSVNLSGWQILNENERIHFTFPQKSEFIGSHVVLARNAVKETVDAQYVFSGSLRNSNEGLRLYDNECNLIDEIPVSSNWSAGNNKTKQTMERTADLSWKNSKSPGGSPGE